MRITMDLGTVQSVSPQMIASMAVLQCGAQELTEYLEEMSYENPLMDLEEPERQTGRPLTDSVADRLRWLRGSDRQNRSYYADPDRDSPDQYIPDGREESLRDFLEEQILTLDLSPELRGAMETVAELLDDRGLYTGDVAEIAEVSGCSETLAAEALSRVRALEPPGVAADSVRGALLMQLPPEKAVARRLLEEVFPHLATWSEGRLARALGVSEAAVTAARRQISALCPYPSGGFAGREEIQYVTPDLCIEEKDGAFTATAREDSLPRVRISSEYLRLLETERDPEVQAWLHEKLRQLEAVLGNLDRRKSTLLRCGEVIAQRQADFFRGGSLRTLTLRDVAGELGLHESTVSRAVKNKYIFCPRGTFPMSAFFSREVGANAGVSRSGIQQLMMEILGQEDPRRPLSDEKIVQALSRRRIVLSRRAVAKYRAELGIPPASARKHGAL